MGKDSACKRRGFTARGGCPHNERPKKRRRVLAPTCARPYPRGPPTWINDRSVVRPARSERSVGQRTRNLPRLAVVIVVVLAVVGSLVSLLSTTTSIPQLHLAPMGYASTFRLTFDHLERSYRLHVPPAAATGKPLP